MERLIFLKVIYQNICQLRTIFCLQCIENKKCLKIMELDYVRVEVEIKNVRS